MYYLFGLFKFKVFNLRLLKFWFNQFYAIEIFVYLSRTLINVYESCWKRYCRCLPEGDTTEITDEDPLNTDFIEKCQPCIGERELIEPCDLGPCTASEPAKYVHSLLIQSVDDYFVTGGLFCIIFELWNCKITNFSMIQDYKYNIVSIENNVDEIFEGKKEKIISFFFRK